MFGELPWIFSCGGLGLISLTPCITQGSTLYMLFSPHMGRVLLLEMFLTCDWRACGKAYGETSDFLEEPWEQTWKRVWTVLRV